MKTNLGVSLSILGFLVSMLSSGSTQAAKTESASVEITKFENRLRKIAQRLEQVDAPIQQMGPESQDQFEMGVDDVQMSFTEVSERLAMVRFVVDRDGSAPQDKRELAQAELTVIENDISSLEEESSTLSNEIDDVVWY